MTIGVAAVLAMIAIGTGAQTAIEDQIRAAGMNLIVVTAGNYKVKTNDDFGGMAVEPSAYFYRGSLGSTGSLGSLGSPARGVHPAIWDPMKRVPFRLIFHPEDDPMEKHDHPTA